MTNGTGFIALAALIFGKWQPGHGLRRRHPVRLHPGPRLAAAVPRRDVGDFEIPSEFWQSLPFVVTIVVVAGAVGRAVAPAADGVPFERSR